jgi:hypothetical protein
MAKLSTFLIMLISLALATAPSFDADAAANNSKKKKKVTRTQKTKTRARVINGKQHKVKDKSAAHSSQNRSKRAKTQKQKQAQTVARMQQVAKQWKNSRGNAMVPATLIKSLAQKSTVKRMKKIQKLMEKAKRPAARKLVAEYLLADAHRADKAQPPVGIDKITKIVESSAWSEKQKDGFATVLRRSRFIAIEKKVGFKKAFNEALKEYGIEKEFYGKTCRG